jgi:hypothetical protein
MQIMLHSLLGSLQASKESRNMIDCAQVLDVQRIEIGGLGHAQAPH